jgi:hypothetical protein
VQHKKILALLSSGSGRGYSLHDNFKKSAHYYCPILIKTGMSLQVLVKHTNIQFHENLFTHY